MAKAEPLDLRELEDAPCEAQRSRIKPLKPRKREGKKNAFDFEPKVFRK